MPYTFSPAELDLIEQWTDQRQRPKEAHHVWNRRIGPQRDRAIHLMGCKAEYLASRMLKVPMHQLDIIGGDGGKHDYVVNDITISVKAIQSNGRFVIVPPHQYPPTSHIMLIFRHISANQMELLGATTSQMFIDHIDDNGRIDLGHGPSYCMPIGALVNAQNTCEFISSSLFGS